MREDIKGITIIGYPVTGKSTVGYELEKRFIPNAQVIDKSYFLSHIPRKLGYAEEGALNELDRFIHDVKNFDGFIDQNFIDAYTREKAILFSQQIRRHFGSESGYNIKIIDAVTDKDKFPIIVGPRYIETIEEHINKGFAVYGLILNDDKERQKRTHAMMHNGSDWGSAKYQLALERSAFDLDNMMDLIKTNSAKNQYKFHIYNTTNLSPHEIAKDIANKVT